MRRAWKRPPIDTFCWLCEYQITKPSGDGPLTLTMDHVIPKIQGGAGKGKKPAHKICNNLRLHQPVTDELKQACRARVEAILAGAKIENARDRRKKFYHDEYLKEKFGKCENSH